MGGEENAPETAPDEWPAHRVHLDSFDIDVHQVSNRCYKGFMEAGGYAESRYWSPEGWAWRVRERITQSAFWAEPAFQVPHHPVVGVSWYEADAYCRWLGGRLPTEAEWEKAARGPHGRRYPWGAEWATQRANGDTATGGITPVGSYPEGVSPYGAHDMAGNVWEWVRDWYGKHSYREARRSNPQGPSRGEGRVLRGGSWNFPPRHLRTAARTHLPPETRIRYLGFRCAGDGREMGR